MFVIGRAESRSVSFGEEDSLCWPPVWEGPKLTVQKSVCKLWKSLVVKGVKLLRNKMEILHYNTSYKLCARVEGITS